MIDDLRTFKWQDVTYCRTSEQGIDLLKGCASVRLLILDHDLGDGDDIGPVIDYLVQRCVEGSVLPIEEIGVCSANPVGAQMMMNALQRWYPNLHRFDPKAFLLDPDVKG